MKFIYCCIILIITYLNSFVKSDCAQTLNNADAFKVSFTYSGINSSNPFDNYIPKSNYYLKNGQLIVDKVNQIMYTYYQFDNTQHSFQSWLYVNNNTYYILDTSKASGCEYRFTPNTPPNTTYSDYGSDIVGSLKAQILSFQSPNEFDRSGLLYVDPINCSPIFQLGNNGDGGNSIVTFTDYSEIEPSISYFYLSSQCSHAHLIV